jgi:predicted MFS family arabinose efflux permease
MAKKKKDEPKAEPPKSEAPKAALPKAEALPKKRDPRIWIYGVLDVVFAALYVVVIFFVAPNRHLWAQLILLALPLFATIMGVGTIVGGLVRGRPIARLWWRLALVGGIGMLVFMVLVLGLLLASAAFLAGVYGSFGQAAAGGILGACALIVEVVGFLPALQLKFLLTRAGKRAFGLRP